MDCLTLPANYEIATKPRTLSVNSNPNMKSIRSVVLGKDGVGKSGKWKKKHSMTMFEFLLTKNSISLINKGFTLLKGRQFSLSCPFFCFKSRLPYGQNT